MKRKIKSAFILFLLCNLFFLNVLSACAEIYVGSQKYADYSKMYLDEDKYEKFNRKVFKFNLNMNKIFVKKIHTVWTSVFPKFVVESLNRAYSNIEYPKRVVSSVLQKDYDALRHETKRFLINTLLGLAGLIDMADKLFKLEMYDEDMEQALAKCKLNCGNYIVLPFISSTNSRDIIGRMLDFALNPTTYIASPIAAAVKMGLLINRTAYIQPIVKMVESNFADSYDIARKFFGVEKYIKHYNYDRKNVIEARKNDYDELDLVDNQNQEELLEVKGIIKESQNIALNPLIFDEEELDADIILTDYNSQNPIIDSMRTALFGLKEINKSFWDETSIWNRSFNKKIKTAYVPIVPDRQKYKFKYILQKNKQSPLAIIFPSVGEGVENSHSAIIAKLFYDEGYSVVLIGSHFQWEFIKSLTKGYKVGLITQDVKYINILLDNIISYLSEKYDRVFLNRVAMGTSLGAYCVLFLASNQYETGANNIDKFISVCPPCELLYAMAQIDKVISSWKNYPHDLKDKVALTSAKVISAFKEKEKYVKDFKSLPFSNYEAKLISAFVFHQKLCDLVYTIEKDVNENIDTKELYALIYSMDFSDYIARYFLDEYTKEEIEENTKLKLINNYLANAQNYRIFHSLDDYLTNKKQLKELKKVCKDKITFFNNGAHLGFMYRDEFIEALKNEIRLDNK